MQLKKLFQLFAFTGVLYGHPLDLRLRSFSVTATTRAPAMSPTPTTTLLDDSHVTKNKTSFNRLYEGNLAFQRTRSGRGPSEAPKVMIISCSDNQFDAGTIFQDQTGFITSQTNLANQFFGKDANANSALTYAVHNLGINHIIVMGHYGCGCVRTAMTTQTMHTNKFVESWLKPIQDIFTNSKRVEIKRFRDANRGSVATVAADDDPGFRALVEENVKESVKRLANESILSTLYGKKANRKGRDLDIYVHGFVFNEENGEVKDLGVSFGPPGNPTFDTPFVVLPKAQLHRNGRKWKAKAKKLAPATTVASTTNVPVSTQ